MVKSARPWWLYSVVIYRPEKLLRDDVMNSNQNHPHLTAEIVSKYVTHHKLETGQLSDLIITVHQAIARLGHPAELEEAPTPAVSVRRSVQHDYVVCLDCGYRGKTLRRHISTRHGMSRDEYLRRWGLKTDHLLTAPAYSNRRSELAKSLGLGRKPSTQVVLAPTPAAALTPLADKEKSDATPKPRRSTRRAAKSMDVASQAVAAEPTPARRGRPRSRARVATQP